MDVFPVAIHENQPHNQITSFLKNLSKPDRKQTPSLSKSNDLFDSFKEVFTANPVPPYQNPARQNQNQTVESSSSDENPHVEHPIEQVDQNSGRSPFVLIGTKSLCLRRKGFLPESQNEVFTVLLSFGNSTKLVSLGKLNLYRNKISGENSNCFDDMTALLHVDISYNALSGLIPNSRVFANALKNYEGIVVCVEMLKDCNLVQILLLF
ncbi:hypothetical protein LguiB_013594 [Lonicera macranthoides]